MGKNLLKKLLGVLFLMGFFALSAFAGTNVINKLSSVKIDTDSDSGYSLNLYFDQNYKEKAFIQKSSEGLYFVFLPNTMTNKNPKVNYRNKKDASKIQLVIESKMAKKDNKDFPYTRISIKMDDNSSLKLLSKVNNTGKIAKNTIAILLAFFFFGYIRKKYNENKNKFSESTSYVNIPDSLKIKETIEQSTPQQVMTTTSVQTINPKTRKVTTTPKFNYADKSSFECFDIPFDKEDNNSSYEFKSMLNQTSTLLNENITPVTYKYTTPIEKITKEDKSELSMPSVEDIMPKVEKPTSIAKKVQAPELLSILKISDNKGFYLTNVEDTIALFGFVNNNIFLFNKFKDLTQINLQARFYDKSGDNDIYIVRLDSFKAMIEISDSQMKELARL